MHTALIIGSFALVGGGLAGYLWDTRDECREFARRVERAARLRDSAAGGRMPRGGSRG